MLKIGFVIRTPRRMAGRATDTRASTVTAAPARPTNLPHSERQPEALGNGAGQPSAVASPLQTATTCSSGGQTNIRCSNVKGPTTTAPGGPDVTSPSWEPPPLGLARAGARADLRRGPRRGSGHRRRTAYHWATSRPRPDSYAQIGVRPHYATMEHLLITHSHADHFCHRAGYRSRGFIRRAGTELVISAMCRCARVPSARIDLRLPRALGSALRGP